MVDTQAESLHHLAGSITSALHSVHSVNATSSSAQPPSATANWLRDAGHMQSGGQMRNAHLQGAHLQPQDAGAIASSASPMAGVIMQDVRNLGPNIPGEL